MKEDLKASLLNLQGLEFIYEKQLFPELEYIFKHVLTQEVTYNSLLLKRRKELHEKIGEAIEQVYAERLEEYYELLAYHYVHSDNTAKAVEYLDLACRKAAKANAMEDAKAYFDKTMELLGTQPDSEENQDRRISLLVDQSNVFMMLLKVTEYHDLLTLYEPVAANLSNLGLRGAFYGRLGFYEVTTGHFDQGIRTLTKAAQFCEAAGKIEESGFVLYFSALGHLLKGNNDRVLEFKEHLLRTMERSFDLRCYVRGLGSVSHACAYLGRWDEAVELGQKVLSTAEDYSDESMITQAQTMLSIVYTYKGDVDRAIEFGERAMARAPTPFDKAGAQMTLGMALCHAGQPHRGIELLSGTIPILKAVRLLGLAIWPTLFLAEGYWRAKEYEKGRQTAEELLGIAERSGVRYCDGYAHYLLGEMSLETDPAQAAAHFDKSITVFQEIKAENVLAMAYAGYGRLRKQQGKVEQARDYLTKALLIFERLGTLMEPEKVRKELAGLPAKVKHPPAKPGAL
jgi:tetratricopeptide (TPR) repeat protein